MMSSGVKGQKLSFAHFTKSIRSRTTEIDTEVFPITLDMRAKFNSKLTNRRAAAIYCISYKRSAHSPFYH